MGLSLGVGLHIALDVFMWLSAIPPLWPLNVLSAGDMGVVNVWKGVDVPEMAKSFRDGNRQIYVMDADGTNQARLTNNAAADFEPAFRP